MRNTRSGHIIQNANMLLTTPLPEPIQTAAPAGRNIRQGVQTLPPPTIRLICLI